MAIVVEDGTGKTDAESYLSVAEADAYHLARGNSVWAAIATQELKEQALRRALGYLEGRFRSSWKGSRLYQRQALSWPRYGVNVDGFTLDTDVIPVDLKNAQAELALRTPTADDLLVEDLGQSVTSEKVGPISVTYADGSTSSVVSYSQVKMMLEQLMAGGSGQFRIVRA